MPQGIPRGKITILQGHIPGLFQCGFAVGRTAKVAINDLLVTQIVQRTFLIELLISDRIHNKAPIDVFCLYAPAMWAIPPNGWRMSQRRNLQIEYKPKSAKGQSADFL
jgi:hypothetical protein